MFQYQEKWIVTGSVLNVAKQQDDCHWFCFFNAAERQGDTAWGFNIRKKWIVTGSVFFNAAERQGDTAWGFNPR
ncbi:MAG: hypothetical protein GY795_12190 [Desulfobacterales bacterium]|nr:hypothetical protein [Desulfobacterales bacterium]